MPAITEAQILEVPLRQWRDVPGSKLRFTAMAGALKELAEIAGDLARRPARRLATASNSLR